MRRLLEKMLMAKPTMFSDSLVLNALGFHYIRIFVFYLRRVVRVPKRIPAQYQPFIKDFKKKGVLIVPNFFPSEDYEYVKSEFERLAPEFKTDSSEIALPHVHRMSFKDARVPRRVKDLFYKNEMINAVVLGFLNRKYNLPMDAATSFTRIHLDDSELNLPQNGGTNNLHFDTPTRLLKCFYYPSDTTEDNAAFYYCLGSNRRNTLKRLFFEYKLSVRYALNRWNPETAGEYLAGEPWVKVTPEEIKRYDLTESVMGVKGNTMVFADISGFHRRGEFKKAGRRDTVELNFRSIESLRNDLYPLEQKFKKLLTQ